MATLTTKTNTSSGLPDTAVLLEPRELFVQPFDVGDWNEIYVAAFISGTTLTGQNSVPPAQSQFFDMTTLVPSNRFCFGLKNNFAALPLDPSETFLGLTGTRSNGTGPTGGISGGGIPSRLTLGRIGAVSKIAGGDAVPDLTLGHGTTENIFQNNRLNDPSGYCNFTVCKITITNKGLPNQAADISYYIDEVNTSTYNVNDLRTSISNAETSNALSSTTNLSFSLNGVPAQVPKAFCIYSPFIFFRLKIHCWGVFKTY